MIHVKREALARFENQCNSTHLKGNKFMNKLFLLLPVVAALSASPAWSQASAAHDHGHGQVKTADAAAAGPVADGEVRKVDKANGKVTIKHGEIKALNMPPMTMVYPVTDAAMLDNLKAGDKVKFTAISDGGKLTVTGIKPAK